MNVARATVAVHSALRSVFDQPDYQDELLGVELHFSQAEDLLLLIDAGASAVLPALSEPDRQQLTELRVRRPLSKLFAIVQDVDGLETHMAFQVGATRVFNLNMSCDQIVRSLSSHCAEPAEAAPVTTPRPEEDSDRRAYPDRRSRPVHDQPEPVDQVLVDRGLVDQLCSDRTIASIARDAYCSERTIYRRIRQIYDQLAVSNRHELRILIGERGQPPWGAPPGRLRVISP